MVTGGWRRGDIYALVQQLALVSPVRTWNLEQACNKAVGQKNKIPRQDVKVRNGFF